MEIYQTKEIQPDSQVLGNCGSWKLQNVHARIAKLQKYSTTNQWAVKKFKDLRRLFGIERKKCMLAGFEFLSQHGAKAVYCLLFQEAWLMEIAEALTQMWLWHYGLS